MPQGQAAGCNANSCVRPLLAPRSFSGGPCGYDFAAICRPWWPGYQSGACSSVSAAYSGLKPCSSCGHFSVQSGRPFQASSDKCKPRVGLRPPPTRASLEGGVGGSAGFSGVARQASSTDTPARAASSVRRGSLLQSGLCIGKSRQKTGRNERIDLVFVGSGAGGGAAGRRCLADLAPSRKRGCR